MAKTIVPETKISDLPGEAGERRGIALEAAWEVSAIADWLCQWWAETMGGAEHMHVRGAFARLQQLSSISMSALDDDDEIRLLQQRLTGVLQTESEGA